MSITSRQRLLSGMAPPLLAVHLLLNGMALFTTTPTPDEVVSSGGGPLRKEQPFELAPKYKAPEPRPITEPQFSRTELDRLLEELLAKQPRTAPRVQVQIPVTPQWVAEWRRVQLPVELPTVIEPAEQPEPAPAAPAVVAKEVIEPSPPAVAPVAAIQEPEPVIDVLAAAPVIEQITPAADSQAALLEIQKKRNQRLALLAAIIFMEQQG